MADGVDKGGLNYPINVDGNWRAELAAFRSEIKGMKSDLDAIKATRASTGGGTGGTGTRAPRVAKQQSEDRLLERLHNEQLKRKLKREESGLQQQDALYQRSAKRQADAYRREFASFRREQARIDRDISRAQERTARDEQRRQVQADQQRLRSQRQSLIAAQKASEDAKRASDAAYRASPQGRAAAITGQAQNRRETEALLRQQGLDNRGNPLNLTLKDRIRDFLGLAKAQDTATKSSNGFLFTFRRLFGVLAFFTIVRNLTNSFVEMVRSMVTVNAELETMRLGMASLFLAVGQVRDATGQAVSPMQGMAISLKEAQRQMQLLRKDSLQTTASFTELAETFQVAIAPGLTSGMNLDQIRTFSVRISQAAQAIGLSQGQLAEEIRSILQGTIQSRTTRIAVALGISNEDIRNAKAAGTLVDFLQRKFSAFALAGEEAMGTFEGVLNRVRNGFVLLLAEGGLGFFETVKDALKDVFKLIVSVNKETGNLEPNPKAVQVFRAIGNSLRDAVLAARDFVASLTFEGVIGTVEAVASVIRTAVRLLSAFASGFLKGMSDVVKVLKALGQGLSSLFGIFDNKNLEESVQLISRFLAYLLAMRVAVGVFGLLTTHAGAATLALAGLLAVSKQLSVALSGKTSQQGDPIEGFALWMNDQKAGVKVLIAEAAALMAQGGGRGGVWTNDSQTFLDQERSRIEEERITKGRQILGLDKDTTKEKEKQAEASSWVREAFDALPGIISQSRRPLSENAELVKQMRTDLDRVKGDLRTMRATQGLSGVASDVAREAAESYRVISEDQRKLTDELKENAAQRNVLLSDLVSLDVRYARLNESQRQAADQMVSSYKKEAKLKEEDYALVKKIRELQLDAEGLQGGDPLLDQINASIAGHRSRLNILRDSVEQEYKFRDTVAAGVENAKDVVKITLERIRLGGNLTTNEENRLAIQKDQKSVDAERVKLLQQQVQLIAERGRYEAEQETRILRAENFGQRGIDARRTQDAASLARGQAPGEAGAAFAEVQAQYAVEIELFAAREEERQRNLAAIDEQIDKLKDTDNSEQAILALERLKTAEQQKQVQEREKELILLERMSKDRQFLDFKDKQPVAAGVYSSMKQMVDEWTDNFTLAVEITRKATEELADFISGAISDAFDPTKKVDLKQRFAQFLKSIADMLTQMLVRMAVIKTLVSVIPGYGNFAKTFGAHDGGRMTRNGPKARGFATGGRPAGLHPSDRIPIWTALGEWVIRASSVRKYGDRVMAAINKGLVDPFQLQALAGVGTGRGTATQGPGFAEGGRVPNTMPSSDAGSRPAYQQAVLLADEGTNDRLAAGGKNSWLRMISRNRSEFRLAMGFANG